MRESGEGRSESRSQKIAIIVAQDPRLRIAVSPRYGWPPSDALGYYRARQAKIIANAISREALAVAPYIT